MSFPCAVTYDLDVHQGKIDQEAEQEAAIEKIISDWKKYYTLAEFERCIPDKLESAWLEFLWEVACYKEESSKDDWQGEPY